MARVLLLGVGPYPTEAGAAVSGPTIRVRQFAEPLRAAGHEVRLLLLEDGTRHVELEGYAGSVAVDPEIICDPARALTALGVWKPEVVVGVGSLMPAFAAVRIGRLLDVPAWADLFGDPLAEYNAVESRVATEPDPVRRDHIWRLMRETILHADHLSTVSERQAHALAGVLLFLGRSQGPPGVHNRIQPVPCGIPDTWVRPSPATGHPDVLAARGLPATAPILYIAGSWTPWLDESRMAKVVLRSLEASPDLRVVLHAGRLADREAQAIRETFLDRLLRSETRSRVLLLESNEAREAELLACSSATLLLDRPIAESFYGSRNRLLVFARWGLLPVVNPYSEIAAELIGAGVAVHGRDDDDSARLVDLAARRSIDQRLADRDSGCLAIARYAFSRTLEPVVHWLHNPSRWAPRQRVGLQDKWAELPANPAVLFPAERPSGTVKKWPWQK